jgi:hypothetical protein
LKYVNLYSSLWRFKSPQLKIIKKTSFSFTILKTPPINNFLSVFLKGGYKEKLFNWFNFISDNLYKLINYRYIKFIYSNELLFNLFINNFHFNFNFLLSWIFGIINFCFFYSITNVPNIFKKKQKTSTSLKLRFFKKNPKQNLLVKFLFFRGLSLNFHLFKTKLYFTLVDFILNYKNSWVYLFKVFFYKKLFKL